MPEERVKNVSNDKTIVLNQYTNDLVDQRVTLRSPIRVENSFLSTPAPKSFPIKLDFTLEQALNYCEANGRRLPECKLFQ